MTDKEKAECFLEIYKARLDHFNQTRTIEFQINIAIWTVVLVGGAFLKINQVDLNLIFYILISLAILVIHFIWLIFIQRSENIDHDYMNEIQKEIGKLVGTTLLNDLDGRIQYAWPQWKWISKLKGYKWIAVEVLMTFSLLISISFINLVKPNSDNGNNSFPPMCCEKSSR